MEFGFLKPQKWATLPDGRRVKHYYPTESVGIATVILLTAVHQCGLVALTHTQSPMGFLNEILGPPADSERPFLLLVVGYPQAECLVPDITRKALDERCHVPGLKCDCIEPASRDGK